MEIFPPRPVKCQYWGRREVCLVTGSRPQPRHPSNYCHSSVSLVTATLRSVFKPFIFGVEVKSITGVTKSPEGSLSAGERKHQLWQAVEASEVKNLFVIKLMMRSSVER